MDPTAQDILHFWFRTVDLTSNIERNNIWFKSTPEFDTELINNFEDIHKQAAAGNLDYLQEAPAECLALVISLDQFPRNIYRGTSEAFHTDPKARAISRIALERGYDKMMSVEPRKFFYLPFVHSENLSDQDIAVEKYKTLNDEKSMRSAIGHRDAIRKFGRFPHRNKILGRDNTPEEKEYLKVPPTWGLTRAEAKERERLFSKNETNDR